jgi:hypothetical protein
MSAHPGPDLALHISPPNSRSSPNVTPPREEHAHGFDLWKQPPKSTDNVERCPAYDGASTVLCLANPPPSLQRRAQESQGGYLRNHLFLPDMNESSEVKKHMSQDFPRGEVQEDFSHLHHHRVFPQAPPVPELSLGRVTEHHAPEPLAMPKLSSYPMVMPRYGSYYGFEDDVGRAGVTGTLSSLLGACGAGYDARQDGGYAHIGFRSRFPPKSPPSKRNIRAPRMRWTSALHAHFVQAVELLGGHESKDGIYVCLTFFTCFHCRTF